MLHIAMIVTTALVSLLGSAPSEPAQVEAVVVAQNNDRGPQCSNVGNPDVAYCIVIAELADGSCLFQCKDGVYH